MGERIKATTKGPESKSTPVSKKKKSDFYQKSSPVDHILFLQRTIGNRAVQGLFKSGAIQTSPDDPIPSPPLQLPISPEESELPEREAPALTLVPSPPVPEQPQTPTQCPNLAAQQRALRESSVAHRVEAQMRRDIMRESQRASRHPQHRSTRALARQADAAVRSEFGSLLPSGRNFVSPSSLSIVSPDELARRHIPNEARARGSIVGVAFSVSSDLLRDLCITRPTHRQLTGEEAHPLVSEVASPLLDRLGIDFIREYTLSKVAGYTRHSRDEEEGNWRRHTVVLSEHRFMGHTLVHEAMHYYVNDTYYTTAGAHALSEELTEGGAELLARHVIHRHLSDNPAFRINYSTYEDEFQYVNTHLLRRGGLAGFALAYFQGRVDLLGLQPTTT